MATIFKLRTQKFDGSIGEEIPILEFWAQDFMIYCVERFAVVQE